MSFYTNTNGALDEVSPSLRVSSRVSGGSHLPHPRSSLALFTSVFQYQKSNKILTTQFADNIWRGWIVFRAARGCLVTW